MPTPRLSGKAVVRHGTMTAGGHGISLDPLFLLCAFTYPRWTPLPEKKEKFERRFYLIIRLHCHATLETFLQVYRMAPFSALTNGSLFFFGVYT
jgi:hypothetical protein